MLAPAKFTPPPSPFHPVALREGVAVAVLVSLMCACAGDEGGKINPGGTDGVDSTPPTTGGGDGDGGDETGAPPQNGYCVYAVGSGEDLIRHECHAEYGVTFSVDVDPAIGGPFTMSSGNVVVTQNESDSEHPFVASCCTDITEAEGYPADDLCTLPHYTNCYRDLIEHVCSLPGAWLDKFASEAGAFQGSAALAEAAKEWRKGTRRQQCFDHFWHGPDDLETADMCDVGAEMSFNHQEFAPSFSIDVLSTVVSNLELTLQSRMDNILPPSDPSHGCEDLTTNDQSPPYPAAGTSGTLFLADATITFDVDGPQWGGEAITGSGEFSPYSSMQAFVNGSGDLVLEAWQMSEDEPTTVGTSSIQADVDVFRLALMGEHVAAPSTGSYKAIAAGKVTFDMSARIDGVSYPIQARNATEIKFLPLAPGVRNCPSWASACIWQAPFTIEYEDSLAGAWTLDMPSKHWVAPLTFAP